MNIHVLILTYYRELLIIAGSLMLFLGLAPIISHTYYVKYHESKWDEKLWPFSSETKYVYSRYIQPSALAVAGFLIVMITIYKFSNS
jgi:hypothetical protein